MDPKKWMRARQSGNIEDRRGWTKPVVDTEMGRKQRQFGRVRDARVDQAVRGKKGTLTNSDVNRAMDRGYPETPTRAMSPSLRGTVERMVGKINSQPTQPHPSPDPRRPNLRRGTPSGVGRGNW